MKLCRFIVSLCCACLFCSAFVHAEQGTSDYFDMPIEALLELEIESIASMMPTTAQKDPAAVTTITQQSIQDSGARDLLEVLEIFVPNTHYIRHHWEASHMGARGIISDRDDKYLLMVNGHVMNNQTHSGALSERDLPMLHDIARIDVIRGAGSVVHGPGAVAMVINITTLQGDDAEGTLVSLQASNGNRVQGIEIRHGHNWSDDHHFLIYAGAANQEGADNEDAPVVYGASNTTTWGEEIKAGEDSQLNHPHHQANYLGKPKLKLHADYEYKNFSLWARYSTGGETMAWSQRAMTDPPNGFAEADTPEHEYSQQQVGYQQLTVRADYHHKFSDTLYGTLGLSYDVFDNERRLFNYRASGTTDSGQEAILLEDEGVESSREQAYLSQLRLNWQAHRKHLLSFGVDYAYEKWGQGSNLSEDSSKAISSVIEDVTPWQTNRYAFLVEHQWTINSHWTNYLGLRTDNDSYTDAMYSPRLATIYAPNQRDTFKFILSQSSRKNFAEELRYQALNEDPVTPEVLKSAELMYQLSIEHWFAGATLFYNELDRIAFEQSTLQSINVAEQKTTGIELELAYQAKSWRFNVSHSYTHLLDFTMWDESYEQGVSAAGYGEGKNLNNWSNHITKLFLHASVTEKFGLGTSLRVFWGYEGAEDYSNYANNLRATTPADESIGFASTAQRDDGYDEPFGASIFWNLNSAYQFNKHIEAKLDAYNLLGLVDKRYNKRLYIYNVSNYRVDPTSVRLMLNLTF